MPNLRDLSIAARGSGRVKASLCGALLIGLVAPALSDAHFVQASYSFGANSCVVANRSDPVTMIFYGFPASVSNVDTEVQRQSGWNYHTGGDQWLQNHGFCDHFAVQDADQITFTRFHTRLWPMIGLDLKNRAIVYATPHHENFVVLGGCGFPGNHAVDRNGPLGSGFDQGRNRLTGDFVSGGYSIGDVQFWGNTQTFHQCDGGDASSNGKVNWINFDQLR